VSTKSGEPQFRCLVGILPQQCRSRRKDHPAQHTSKPAKNPSRFPSGCQQSSPQQNTPGCVFRRLRARLHAPKAITTMAHKLARIAWHLVSQQVTYDQSIFALHEEELLRRKQRQLRNLGFILVPQAPAAATLTPKFLRSRGARVRRPSSE
jgi:hypothetical protein